MFHDPSLSGVHDWSTCDWVCTKVLGPYVANHPRRRQGLPDFSVHGGQGESPVPPLNTRMHLSLTCTR